MPKRKQKKNMLSKTTLEGVGLVLKNQLDRLEEICGGRQRLIFGLMATDNPTAKRFAAELGKSSNDHLSIYEVCQKLHTSPSELLEAFTQGDMVRSTVEAFVELSDGLPAIIRTSISQAQEPGGIKDRELLLDVAGLRKGSGTQINLNQQLNFSQPGTFESVISKPQGNPFDLQPEDFEDVPS